VAAAHVSRAPAVESEDRQLELALRPAAMGIRLAAALGDRVRDVHGRAGGSRAHCDILDAKYRPGKDCSILYRLEGHMVLGKLVWGRRADPGPHAVSIPDLGMEVYPFPHDPALPGLAAALDGPQITAALDRGLERRSDDAHIVNVRPTPVRYRPGRRCTLRLDISLRASGAITRETLFGKVYHDADKAASVHNDMKAMATLGAVRDGSFSIAPVAGFLPAIPMVLQEPVGGTPLDSLLPVSDGASAGWIPAAGRDALVRAAAALAALHGSRLLSKRQRPVDDELRKLGSRISAIQRVHSVGGGTMKLVAEKLSAGVGELEAWGACETAVHGDCKPSQFLVSEETVTMLDFDHCGMADPATDVGTFLATLRKSGMLRGGSAATPDATTELEELFLDQYCRLTGSDAGFRRRATWYEALALLRKAERAFARSVRSPLSTTLAEDARGLLQELEEERG
jgi:aminoglycoside phosphotransferase (APT) family kinase protein